MTRLVLVISLLFGLAQPAAAQISVPVHGNWCGPGHFGGPALDALDAACLRHDLCIAAHGAPFDCGCDLAFMDELRRGPWPNEWLYLRARGVYEAIALIPCSDPQGQATKLDWAARDWLGNVLSGRELPTASLGRFLRMFADGVAGAY